MPFSNIKAILCFVAGTIISIQEKHLILKRCPIWKDTGKIRIVLKHCTATIGEFVVNSFDYENTMLKAFIGKPKTTEYYRNTFAKYNINGVDHMVWSWNYWVAFGGIFFFLYRKLYIEAGVILFVSDTTKSN